MRPIIIDVSSLVNLRETTQLKRSIFHAIVFSLLAGLYWSAIEQIQFTPYSFILRELTATVILMPFLVIILLRKNYISRLIYFLILTLNIIFFLLVSAVGIIQMLSTNNNSSSFLLLSYALLYSITASKHAYRLFFSLASFGRKKNLTHEISYSSRLWAGEWRKSRDENFRKSEKINTNISTRGQNYRLGLGISAFIIGLIFTFLLFFNALRPEVLYSIYILGFPEARYIIRDFLVADSSRLVTSETWFAISSTLLLTLIALLWFFIFGFFRNQRRREKTLIHRSFLSRDITSSDILLLRSFKDDVKQVNKHINPFLLPFNLYPWDSTLEQVIVTRLKNVGEVHLLDVQKVNKDLLKKGVLKVFVKLLGEKRVRSFLKLHCPMIWRKIPPIGGVRHYLPKSDNVWQQEISKSMPIAQMQIVVLGEEPQNLDWEMKEINRLNLLEKTIFLMPPLTFSKNYDKRWKKFTDDYLNKIINYDDNFLQKIKPSKILAVCIRENNLICIIGKGHTYFFYESAIDIGTIITISDRSISDLFILPYL